MTHSDPNADSDRMREQAFLENCAVRGLAGRVVALPRARPIGVLPPELDAASSVFCVNDAMALKLQLRLPADRLLLGIDGLAGTFVTCAQPMERMARAAVECLLRHHRLGARWKAGKRFFKGALINE